MVSTHLNAGTATKAVVKATAGNVYAVMATNVGASLRWFQLHNKATAPAAADVAQLFFPLPAGTAPQPTVLEINATLIGGSEPFVTGCGWAISSTPDTFTDAATANEHTVLVRFT